MLDALAEILKENQGLACERAEAPRSAESCEIAEIQKQR